MDILSTINRILPICLVTALASAMPASAQETPTQSAPAPILPVKRTLADKSGRKMEATILSAKNSSLRVRRADGKEVTIDSTTLSPEDQQFFRTLPQGDPISLPFSSSIAIDVKIEKGKDDDAKGGMEYVQSTATPTFVHGRDMTAEPAFVRVIMVQQNSDPKVWVSTVTVLPTPGVPIKPVVTMPPFQKSDPVKFLWYVEVWQGGKLLCKSYDNYKFLETLPPATKEEKSHGSVN